MARRRYIPTKDSYSTSGKNCSGIVKVTSINFITDHYLPQNRKTHINHFYSQPLSWSKLAIKRPLKFIRCRMTKKDLI